MIGRHCLLPDSYLSITTANQKSAGTGTGEGEGTGLKGKGRKREREGAGEKEVNFAFNKSGLL
jgi:hypothetical protein